MRTSIIEATTSDRFDRKILFQIFLHTLQSCHNVIIIFLLFKQEQLIHLFLCRQWFCHPFNERKVSFQSSTVNSQLLQSCVDVPHFHLLQLWATFYQHYQWFSRTNKQSNALKRSQTVRIVRDEKWYNVSWIKILQS